MNQVKKVKRTPEQEKIWQQYLPMVQYGKKVGCKPDQLENFIKAGIFLQPKQLEFCAAARACDSLNGPTKVGYGGARGGGKSFCLLAQVAADDCQRYANLTVLYLRKVKKAAAENFEEFRKKICVSLPNEYLQQKGIMSFPNGSKVMIGHFANDNDIDQYLGREFDIICIEELTQLTDGKIKDILSCLRSSKPGWRPRMYANWNWGGVGHAFVKNMFYEPFRDKRETDTRFVKATVYDNQILLQNNPEYVRNLESFTGWKRKSWLDGDPDFQAGQYFTNWNESAHVIEAIDFRNIVRWYGGFDYGRTHPTVFLLAGEDKQGRMFIMDEHHEARLDPHEHVGCINHILYRNHVSIDSLDYVFAGRDCFASKEDGHTIADTYGSLGLFLTPAEVDRVSGFAKILERLGDVDKGIPPTLFIHRKCSNLIAQIPMAQHNPKRPEDIAKMNADSETDEGGDDALECLRNIIGSNPGGAMKFIAPAALTRSPYKALGFG